MKVLSRCVILDGFDIIDILGLRGFVGGDCCGKGLGLATKQGVKRGFDERGDGDAGGGADANGVAGAVV